MVDHAALAAVLNEFSATVTGEFSSTDILRQLASSTTRVLNVAGVGVMAPRDGDLLRFVFATNPTIGEVERLQEELATGPCAEVNETGMPINLADIRVEGRWPTYQARAAQLGLHAVTALPLRARGRIWGVLDLYRTEAVRLDDAEFAAAQTLANLATSYLVVTADRDTARDAQRELAYRAMHDPLTGLPVRWVFLEQLDQSLARLQRRPGHVGVLFIDLDGLKYVNDTHGHAAGDRLIMACVDRISSALRPADVLARIGGDEFVVLLEDIDGVAAAAGVAERIIERLAAPYRPDGEVIQPAASVGVAATADPEETGDVLIAHADAAMYQAKHAGRGRIELFDRVSYAAGQADSQARHELTRALHAALGDGELELHYQPIVRLADAAPADGPPPSAPPARSAPWAVEALVRWRHPVRGLLVAGEFIDVAERHGLIVDVGDWVVRTACAQLAAWDSGDPTRSPRRLFVNISTTELTRPGFPALVATALDDAGVPPERLVLEITETGLMSEPAAALAAMTAVRDIGCELAIDDFGTGYSSLSRLVGIPASILKTDQSFARDIAGNSGAAAVVSAVLNLGESLDRVVIVEGVEDAATLRTLQALGTTHVQGFHLARPAPPGALLGVGNGNTAGDGNGDADSDVDGARAVG